MRKLIILLIPVFFVLALVTFSEDANSAARVYKGNHKGKYHCYGWSNWKYCTTINTKWQYVNTPSGNRKYSGKTSYTYEFWTSGKKVYSGQSASKWNWLAKKGKLHLYKSKYSNNYTFSYGGTQYCFKINYTGTYQYVNGKVTKQSSNYSRSNC